MTPKDRALVENIERVLDEKPERRPPEDFDYAVPAPEGGGGFRRSRYAESRQSVLKHTKEPRYNGMPVPHRGGIFGLRPAE